MKSLVEVASLAESITESEKNVNGLLELIQFLQVGYRGTLLAAVLDSYPQDSSG